MVSKELALISNFPSLTKSITNSANYASKKYGISHGTLACWLKLSNFESKSKAMSKNDELKKLRERIEELEFVKDFQQDVIADFEPYYRRHLSKVFARTLAKR
jgi:hypothetical protein